MYERYFDNAATTPLDPRVLEEMLPFLRAGFGNANSLHEPGRRAHEAVELARQRVAQLLSAEDSSQITFTSGATESNNWVLQSAKSVAVSPFEHSSIYEPAKMLDAKILQNNGIEITPPTTTIDLVSVMDVNNEVGTKWVTPNLRGNAVALHSDITQAAGKLPIDLSGVNFASFSAHKFYGPKGIGGLYSQDAAPDAFILGGEQENGKRGGTLNVPAIVGMGAAAAIAVDERAANLSLAQDLRTTVLDVMNACPDMQINGGPTVSPYILSLSFLGIEGETLVIEMDRRGYSLSSGAACSSQSTEPSHVLKALGLGPEWLRGTVRISFGRGNNCEVARNMSVALLECVELVRKML